MKIRKSLAVLLIVTLLLSAATLLIANNVSAQDDSEDDELDCRPGAFRFELNLHEQLDMPPEEIRDFMMNGGTIESLLEASDIDVDALRQETLDHAQACIAQAVEVGQLTQERANQIPETLEAGDFPRLLRIRGRFGFRSNAGFGFGIWGPGFLFDGAPLGPRARFGRGNLGPFGPGGYFSGSRGNQRGLGPF